MRPSPLLRLIGVVALVVAAGLVVRALVAVPRRVPSASMVPTLAVGDVFMVLRWPYGSALARRLSGRLPNRGDVIVVRGADGDVVKRVIGRPGDRVALVAGAVILNGRAVPRYRVADLFVPAEPGVPCADRTGTPPTCRVARWRELLPGGAAYDTLDLGPRPTDDMAEVRVPQGRLFLLGDNRDRSADSRVGAEEGGLGLVSLASVVGRGAIVLWSTDAARAAGWSRWWRGVRTGRSGMLLAPRRLGPSAPAARALTGPR